MASFGKIHCPPNMAPFLLFAIYATKNLTLKNRFFFSNQGYKRTLFFLEISHSPLDSAGCYVKIRKKKTQKITYG